MRRACALAAVALMSVADTSVARGDIIAATQARTACSDAAPTKLAPRALALPRDDGAHDGFASEWWRTFGRVSDARGRRYDFSVNVSRFALGRCGAVATTGGRWSARDVVTTSWTLLDESTYAVRRGSHTERSGSFGATLDTRRLDITSRIATYRARTAAPDRSRDFRLTVDDRDDGLALEQTPGTALPLGPGAIVRAGSCATCEAYAYAYPRSETHGTLRIAGVSHAVAGSTWIEHEYARHELASTDAGWSRYELQFDDGRDLDARFTRDASGRVVTTSGVFVSARGAVTYLHDGDARLANVMHTSWRSAPTGVTYPSLWQLTVPFAHLTLATVELVLDQEIRDAARTPYVSGAIVVERVGPPEADHGHGYVELTGYGAPLSL